MSEKRLSLLTNGDARYELKTPYRDGTTHVIFEPLDFIARLVALVPKPRVNLTRFHGVFAPNSAHRARVTPAKRGKGNNKVRSADAPEHTAPAERRAAMSWAQRLKRVFNIDIDTCKSCGGQVKVIACIEAPVVIEKTLTHLDRKDASGAAQQGRHQRGCDHHRQHHEYPVEVLELSFPVQVAYYELRPRQRRGRPIPGPAGRGGDGGCSGTKRSARRVSNVRSRLHSGCSVAWRAPPVGSGWRMAPATCGRCAPRAPSSCETGRRCISTPPARAAMAHRASVTPSGSARICSMDTSLRRRRDGTIRSTPRSFWTAKEGDD